MKASSLKEIKNELDLLHPGRLKELCLHLAKYKKENKELLTYLLFESDEQAYIQEIKEEMDALFKEINKSNSYLAKKSIRKTLRIVQKYSKYSGSKQTEIELLLYFCYKLKKVGIPLHANTALGNIYLRQVQKIQKSVATLHEDLQFDYSDRIRLL